MNFCKATACPLTRYRQARGAVRKFLFGLLLCIFSLSLASPGRTQQLLSPIPGKPVAKDFELPDLDGRQMKLSAFKGYIVVVNFWATWCPPCRAEIPSMQRAWTILKEKNVVFLAVHVGGNEDKVWSFLTDKDVDFPVLMDADSQVSHQWPVNGLPPTFVIDPQGRVAFRAIGGREWDDPTILETILGLAK